MVRMKYRANRWQEHRSDRGDWQAAVDQDKRRHDKAKRNAADRLKIDKVSSRQEAELRAMRLAKQQVLFNELTGGF